MTFIVRVTVDPSGQVQGVIERVKTGAKCPFDDLDAIGPLIALMAKDDMSPGEEKGVEPC